MAKSVLELAVGTGQWNAGLKKAKAALDNFTQANGGLSQALDREGQKMQKFVKMIGSMDSTAKTAKGQMNDYKSSIEQLTMQYNRMSEAQKKVFGSSYLQAIEQLKDKYRSVNNEIQEMNRSLGNTKMPGSSMGGNGGLTSLMSELGGNLGSQFGIDTSMLSGLTAGTVAYTAAIGAAAAAAAYAAKEFAKYNDELAKQQQITSVTTGLKGDDAGNMTASARSLSRVYGTDFREVINAANTLMTQFGQTGDEAIQLLRDGMQGMIQGDGPKLLQMIQQYAPAFRDAGVSASQLIAVIQNSEGGIFTDQNMNAIVMGIKNIRLMTTATSEALAQLGIDGKKMSEQLGNGTLTVFDALKQVATAIENTNSSSQAAGQVMQQVFGRQGAMAGTKLGEAIATLNLNLEETKKQTGDVGESLASLNLKTEEFEKRLMSVFGIDGWDTMNNQIKEGLIVSLNKLLVDLEGVRDFLNDINIIGNNLSVSGIVTFFADIAKEVYLILNPLMEVVRLIGYLQNLANQGRPSTGSTHELTPEERKINELASRGGGMSIDEIVVTPTKPVVTTKKRGGGGGGNRTTQVKTEEQENSEQIQKLAREFEKASEDRRKAIQAEIKALQQRNAEIKYYQELALGKEPAPLNKKIEEGTGITDLQSSSVESKLKEKLDPTTIVTPLQAMEDELRSVIELQALAWSPEQFAAYQERIDEIRKKIGLFKGISKTGEETKGSWQDAAKAVQSVGAAMQNIEDPAAKVAGTVLQAVANVALGYANALTMAKEAGGPWGWIAFAATGLATMMTTISAIHSATGYAEGGMVKGNSYSGDNLQAMIDGGAGGFAGLNSGEIVLNRAAQGNLASQLEGNGIGNARLVGRLKGRDLLISIERELSSTGKGQIVTWL